MKCISKNQCLKPGPTTRLVSQIKARRRREAFTLVEVMLAVVVASVIFAAVGFGLTTGFGLVQISREELRANQICLSRMEGIRLCRWDTQLFDPNIVPRTFTDYFYPVGLKSATNAYVVYQGKVTLETNLTLSPNPSYVSNLCKVTVQVTWAAKNNLIQTQTVTTLVSKNGIQNYVFSQ
jgi:prepilin-type N-terminal cleavage/methylation domain-containing protein